MARYIDAEALTAEFKRLTLGENSLIEKIFADGVYAVIETFPTADVVEIPNGKIGDISDGYHTFNELYHHRAILFSVICNSMPDKAWKSKLHDTGDMFDGMFIVGIETEQGQATYHYDIEPYWDMFKVKELENAPKWDGHTPQEAIDRISKLSADVVPRSEVEKIFAEIDKIIDKHYNNHIFGNNDLEDEEKEAVINFSDDVTYDIDKLKEERKGDQI